MAYEIELPGGYAVSDDQARLDVGLIHRFLATESYWAAGRTREMVERTIAGSLCLGLYGAEGQAGFARVITDRALFAWMADVFVLPAVRGRGLGRAMVAAILAHPDLADVQRWMLVTADAEPLYRGFGFSDVTVEDRLMKRAGQAPVSARSEHPARTP